MVMGPTHAMSGAAAWLAAAPAVAAVSGAHLSTPELLVGAAVCAGSALLPDIDEPSSTVARSFGPATQALAHVVNNVSAAVHNATATRADGHTSDGHRTVTHTALFAVAAGAGVSTLAGTFGTPAVVGVLFFTLGLAIRGLLGSLAKKEGWLGVTVAAMSGAWATAITLGDGHLWWLGFAVTAGVLLHSLGDALTKEGVPLLAPAPYRGKAWWEFNTGPFSFRAGGIVEYAVVAPLLTAVAVYGLVRAVDPTLARTIVGLA